MGASKHKRGVPREFRRHPKPFFTVSYKSDCHEVAYVWSSGDNPEIRFVSSGGEE